LSHPGSFPLRLGGCGSELVHPGLVVFDGLFGEEMGSPLDRGVSFAESDRHVGVVDPGGARDEPGDEVVGCSAAPPGCFDPPVDAMVKD
jgi:hypothetical protein